MSKRQHGGARPGAGRKPLADGGVRKVSVSLLPIDLEELQRVEDEHGLEGMSAAVRHLIDQSRLARETRVWKAAKREAARTEPKPKSKGG